MRKPLIFALTLAYLAFLPAGSCNTPEPKPVPTDVDAGSEPEPLPAEDACSGYCTHLSDLQCSEGTHPKCRTLCTKVLEENLIRLPINCVMGATTKKAAIECGADCK